MGHLDDMFKGGGGFFDQMTASIIGGLDELTQKAQANAANKELQPTTTMAEAQTIMQDQAVIDHQIEVDTLSAADNLPEEPATVPEPLPEPPQIEAGQ